MTLLLISFFAGMLTVLAPCILPLLPIVIGRGISGGRNTTIIVIASLSVSIFVFTLILKASTALIAIPQSFWSNLSGGILIVFGLFTLFEHVWVSLMSRFRLQEKANAQFSVGFKKKNIWGDVIMGGALGPVFSTCSPTYFVILATVLPANYSQGIIYLLAYIIGLAFVLLCIGYIGEKFVTKLNILANPKGWFKRIIAITFIVIGIAIMTGFDKKAATILLDAGLFDVTKVEQNILDTFTPQMNSVAPLQNEIESTITKESSYRKLLAAPELSSIDAYINTNNAPITLEQSLEQNKVVLVYFWTYSCINCKRTLPYLNDWYTKYHDMGLEIIGIHTPEFAFERVTENVQAAVVKEGVLFPVAIDNDFSTWNAYKNNYWPHMYLVDQNGRIVYDHAGEGAYKETEEVIQELLARKIQKEVGPN